MAPQNATTKSPGRSTRPQPVEHDPHDQRTEEELAEAHAANHGQPANPGTETTSVPSTPARPSLATAARSAQNGTTQSAAEAAADDAAFDPHGFNAELAKPATAIEIKERWISIVHDSNRAMESIQSLVDEIMQSTSAEIERLQKEQTERLADAHKKAQEIQASIPEGVELKLTVEDIFPAETTAVVRGPKPGRKPAAASAPAPTPARQAPKPRRTSSGQVSKMDAVRQCIAEKGPEVLPKQIVEYVQQQFSIEMPTSIASNYKSLVIKESGKKPVKAPKAPKPKPVSNKGTGRKASKSGLKGPDLVLNFIGDNPGTTQAPIRRYLKEQGNGSNPTVLIQTLTSKGLIRGDNEKGYHINKRVAAH